VEEGWSLKKLHRLILTSRTYQQGTANEPSVRRDPDNRLLARMPIRRLEAEQIRDALLSITGKLDLTNGGPSVDLRQPRRSVYLKALRNTREPLLDVFDLPEGFLSAGKRHVSTSATQALLMMNSPFMRDQAKAFAERLRREAGSGVDERVARAF